MFIEYIPPIATAENVGKFKVDGTSLEVDENGMLKTYRIPYEAILDDNTQEQISAASEAGVAADLQSVGDCKKITLNGTVGTLSLSNYDTYVFILDFDHNSSLEGTGISFGGFRTASTNGIETCLVDNNYASYSTSSTKYFSMNHQGSGTYGGQKGCDLRYDVLGSTNIAPSNYGSTPTSGRTGYDASSTTTTNPVNNTLMAALSSDLRVVMKPITKYTDNIGGGSGGNTGNITSSIDYLPLLSSYEVTGAILYGNYYEQNYQTQYTYFINGSSTRIRYKHSSTSTTALQQLRSVYIKTQRFCYIKSNGSEYYYDNYYSFGLSPVFLV